MMSSWSVDRLNGTYEGIYVLPSKVRTKVVPSYEGTKIEYLRSFVSYVSNEDNRLGLKCAKTNNN